MHSWQEQVSVSSTKDEMARAAADYAIGKLARAMQRQPKVRLLAATGASQLEFLAYVTASRDVDWTRVELFHLDEYVGIGMDHPASFARYIRQRIVDPAGISMYHLLDGAGDPAAVIRAASEAVSREPVDVALVGIGENAHLAFNDPPADFDTEVAYLLVNLDLACRLQQVGEGWFPTVESVPKQAISMSIRQILKSKSIVCTVPDERKAKAVRASLKGPVSPDVPASILQTHSDVYFFLDRFSAKLLDS